MKAQEFSTRVKNFKVVGLFEKWGVCAPLFRLTFSKKSKNPSKKTAIFRLYF